MTCSTCKTEDPDRFGSNRYTCLPCGRASARARRMGNPDKYKIRDLAYRLAHGDDVRRRTMAWQATHEDERRAYLRNYRATHPSVHRESCARRRASVMVASPGLKRIYEAAATVPMIKCYYCGKRTRREDRHVDHIWPLSKGGIHIEWNLCVSCRECNMKKHNLTPDVFCGQFEIPLWVNQ